MALMLDNCEGILLSLDSHKSVPAPFLTKTYQLVDDPSTDHIVSWGEDDTTFVVWRPPEFARDLLPNYFKHNNFSSFVRQLNTYGFRKIVPDRWEFANEFFKKGDKHLLCEIHRRKTSQPQVTVSHHHHHPSIGGPVAAPVFFQYPGRGSISPSESDEQANWYESSSPLSSPRAAAAAGVSVAALSEDNERLRRSNSMLLSELAHMKKLYNDIIYFVQNHVRPVTPSTAFPSSLMICNTSIATAAASAVQKPLHQLLEFHQSLPKQAHVKGSLNSTSTSSSSLTVVEETYNHNKTHNNNNNNNDNNNSNNGSRPKLFGVPLHSKKRLHPEPTSPSRNVETMKARFVLRKEDLGLNLMPPSPC
ncbi:heat stress transcription factor B-4 [Magnolia sinica]|uniref:heat stress transcription factor B-4 n=1 Tax=Magnolia sinica TaxID=86752 RepID=UPI002658F4A9|nr:heat stress transcription factor B-4 [Magnolia sinica]